MLHQLTETESEITLSIDTCCKRVDYSHSRVICAYWLARFQQRKCSNADGRAKKISELSDVTVFLTLHITRNPRNTRYETRPVRPAVVQRLLPSWIRSRCCCCCFPAPLTPLLQSSWRPHPLHKRDWYTAQLNSAVKRSKFSEQTE